MPGTDKPPIHISYFSSQILLTWFEILRTHIKNLPLPFSWSKNLSSQINRPARVSLIKGVNPADPYNTATCSQEGLFLLNLNFLRKMTLPKEKKLTVLEREVKTMWRHRKKWWLVFFNLGLTQMSPLWNIKKSNALNVRNRAEGRNKKSQCFHFPNTSSLKF